MQLQVVYESLAFSIASSAALFMRSVAYVNCARSTAAVGKGSRLSQALKKFTFKMSKQKAKETMESCASAGKFFSWQARMPLGHGTRMCHKRNARTPMCQRIQAGNACCNLPGTRLHLRGPIYCYSSASLPLLGAKQVGLRSIP